MLLLWGEKKKGASSILIFTYIVSHGMLDIALPLTRALASPQPQGIVPHFITCNAFIGRSYAQVLSGFLRDCVRGGGGLKLDRTEPLYIIELGAGSGKFSFFMLKALLEMKVRKRWGGERG